MITDSRPAEHADRAWVMAAFLLGVMAQGTLRDPGALGCRHEALTHGETRVLHYLPTNLTAPEIAADLYLSVNTVKTHQRHLYAKLGARSRTEAVARARALGLLARTGAPRAVKSPNPDDARSPSRARRLIQEGGAMEPSTPGARVREELCVHNWRVSQLTRLGVPVSLAEIYADRIDWHQVARLVQRGCPARLALRIVR